MANLRAKTNNAWWFGSTVVLNEILTFFVLFIKKSYFCTIDSRLFVV